MIIQRPNYLFAMLVISSDGTKAKLGKTAGAFAQMKATTPKGTCVHGILHCHTRKVKQIPLILNVLDETVSLLGWRFINFIKFLEYMPF